MAIVNLVVGGIFVVWATVEYLRYKDWKFTAYVSIINLIMANNISGGDF
jgi:hypothetical protein